MVRSFLILQRKEFRKVNGKLGLSEKKNELLDEAENISCVSVSSEGKKQAVESEQQLFVVQEKVKNTAK